jgi:CRP/FNR family cyclic AMP-dependent transcriptional regulator
MEYGRPGKSLRKLLAFSRLYATLYHVKEETVAMPEILSYTNILKQADIFYKLSLTQLEMIGQICQERTFQTGEVIVHEGANTNDLYIIASGEVDILLNPALVSDHPGAEYSSESIATLRRGQSFGEIALVDKGIRTATVRALQNKTRVLIIPREKLMLLCDTYPQLGYRLMQNLATDLALKMRSTDLRIRADILYSKYSK